MKNAMKLLYAIGQIQDSYIVDAHSSTEAANPRRNRIVLIAVAAAVLLLLAGCAVFAWHWYEAYFTGKRTEPLAQSQVDYIENHTQIHQLSQTCNGFTVELISTISESNSAYVTFTLTAPEGTDLSGLLDLRTEERLSFKKLFAVPDGSVYPVNLTYDVADNGDGRNNTLNVVLHLIPIVEQGAESSFGTGKTCKITFRDIIRWGYDWDYEQELLSTKYAGQQDIMFTPEEAERLHPQTVLASGEWVFEVELGGADTNELILLDTPQTAKVLVVRVGANEFEAVDCIEDVTLTNIRITPLSVEISFDRPEPLDTFECVFADATMAIPAQGNQKSDYDSVTVVLKNGTKIGLFQEEGAKQTAVLRADSPIVLNEVDYLQMSDGTRIMNTAAAQ